MKPNCRISRKHETKCLLINGPLNEKHIYLNPTSGGTLVFTLNGQTGYYDKQPLDIYCTWRTVAR